MMRVFFIGLALLAVLASCAVVTVLASATDRRLFLGLGTGCGATDAEASAVAEVLGTGYGTVQAGHAITIWQTGAGRGLPDQAMVVAIATAMQESALRVLANLAVPASYDFPHDGEGADHDSVGLFQQRQSWGPTEVLMDPAGSAGLFYDKLEAIDGWQDLPVTVAAQKVQVSAYPHAYAKHEAPATAAVELIASGGGGGCGEWVHPVPDAPVVSAWRSASRPSHNGTDLGAERGAEIYAAAAGQVVTVVCNAHTPAGRQLSCDADGSPQIMGCGWYVEVAHAEGVLSRYCHMVQKPAVNVGDTVAAGDVLGYVGSSGRSSGPHLHIEIHRAHKPVFDTAVDPEWFFETKGIQL